MSVKPPLVLFLEQVPSWSCTAVSRALQGPPPGLQVADLGGEDETQFLALLLRPSDCHALCFYLPSQGLSPHTKAFGYPMGRGRPRTIQCHLWKLPRQLSPLQAGQRTKKPRPPVELWSRSGVGGVSLSIIAKVRDSLLVLGLPTTTGLWTSTSLSVG